MLLQVDPSDPLPVTEQLCRQLRLLVSSGQLRQGGQLPTIRQLAADLGIAKGTVSRVYELLASEGLVEGNGRRGTAVAQPRHRRSSGAQAELAQHATRLALAAVQAGVAVDQVHKLVDEALASVQGHA